MTGKIIAREFNTMKFVFTSPFVYRRLAAKPLRVQWRSLWLNILSRVSVSTDFGW